MVKLIRLASDNNGIFNSNFQTQMTIKPYSKIALLNVTFATSGAILTINDKNKDVTFQSDKLDVSLKITEELETGSYTAEKGIGGFINNLIQALNKTLDGPATINVALKPPNCFGSQFNIRTDGPYKRIEYRYAPFINPMFLPRGQSGEGDSIMNFDANLIDVGVTANLGTTTIRKQTGGLASIERNANLITGIGRLASGSGIMTCIPAISDNGSGLQDNGLAIGLTRTKLTTVMDIGQEIPLIHLGYEIRINRPGESYKYRKPGGGEQDGVILLSTTVGKVEGQYDMIFFEAKGGLIIGGVYQYDVASGAGIRHEFFSDVIQTSEELYPYIYINGATTTTNISGFNISLDPWINQDYSDSTIKDEPFWGVTGDILAPQYRGNVYSGFNNYFLDYIETGGILNATVITAGDELTFPDDIFRWGNSTPINAELTLHSDIWNFLGFQIGKEGYIKQVISIGESEGNNCWSFLTGSQGATTSNSDNYLIESNTLLLDSFDASESSYNDADSNRYVNPKTDKEGRRKNILMTLPVNDNTSGIVEFQTNTPIYIDINNEYELNQRQLNFQILDKNFQNIETTSETSIMTLLISD